MEKYDIWPDIFTFANGDAVSTKEDWTKHAAELRKQKNNIYREEENDSNWQRPCRI